MTASPWLLLAIIVVPVGVALLIIAWPRWRRRRLAATPFPEEWERLLIDRLAPYQALSVGEQARLRQLIRQFLNEKRFFGCGGVDVTDVMRLLIAAQACLLMLNRRGELFPGLRYILVYPEAFVAPRVEYLPGGVELAGEQDLEGESWSQGKLILSWDDVERDLACFDDGHNVTLHEFAHQLDDETGSTNGAPPLGGTQGERWHRVMSAAYERLVAAVEGPVSRAAAGGVWPERCRASREFAIDPYGATSPAEFFAVVTELFFERPERLQTAEPELFEMLGEFYGVDPRGWAERTAAANS